MDAHPPLQIAPAGPGPSSGRAEGRARQPAPDESELLARLRGGNEAAFAALVDRHHASMIRVARMYVATAAAAEEVAQEAWLGVLQGLASFQGRCSVKAWIFSIVSNCAKTRGARDKRSVPLSSLGAEDDPGGPSVEPERFLSDGHPRWPGHWAQAPEAWSDDALVSRETMGAIAEAIEALPPSQRAVMTMRDVEGLGSEEVCQVLNISEANQRVLLHRARSKVRKALEGYLSDGEVQS